MAKKTTVKATSKETDGSDIIDQVIADTKAEEATVRAPRERQKRRKTYVRPKESDIPQSVINFFAQDDYELRWVRWAIKGDPDYRYLNRREQEGYEFVTLRELPEQYARTLRVRDTQITKGLITNGGDLCLMKIDKDLRQSRQDYLAGVAQQQVDAVNMNVLEKRGLKNVGTRSSVSLREPSFQD